MNGVNFNSHNAKEKGFVQLEISVSNICSVREISVSNICSVRDLCEQHLVIFLVARDKNEWH